MTNDKPTRAEILSATPEQLRLWVAEYYMGWKSADYGLPGTGYWIAPDGSTGDCPPNYPVEIGAAWAVIEKLKLTYSITIENCTDKTGEVICRVFVPFTNDRAWASADNAAMAICRAALLAKQAEQERP